MTPFPSKAPITIEVSGRGGQYDVFGEYDKLGGMINKFIQYVEKN